LLSAILILLAVTGILLHHPTVARRVVGEPANPGPLGDPTTALAVDPRTAGHLFVGTRRGLFESLDGGRSWHDVLLQAPAKNVVAVAFAPEQSGRVSVALADGGVFVSDDAGHVWDDAGLPAEAGEERVQSATFGGGEIVVRTAGGLYVGRGSAGASLDRGPHGGGSRLRYIEALHRGTWPWGVIAVLENIAALGILALVVTGVLMILQRSERRARAMRR
jgi:hypothetical protein